MFGRKSKAKEKKKPTDDENEHEKDLKQIDGQDVEKAVEVKAKKGAKPSKKADKNVKSETSTLIVAEPLPDGPPPVKVNKEQAMEKFSGIETEYSDTYEMDEVSIDSGNSPNPYDILLNSLAIKSNDRPKAVLDGRPTLLHHLGIKKLVFFRGQDESKYCTQKVIWLTLIALILGAALIGAYVSVAVVPGLEEPSVGNSTLSPTSAPIVPTPPTELPTVSPTEAPTKRPTHFPTTSPTKNPTPGPSKSPTQSPTLAPGTPSPTTASPTQFPTRFGDTPFPTSSPTVSPTSFPTAAPTSFPTTSPTTAPTSFPTTNPTTAPTSFPTTNPTTDSDDSLTIF